jgi:hypothetical protein
MTGLMQNKLLELLVAIELIRDQGNDDAWLDAETIDRLSHMETFVRAWLQDESPLTEADRVIILSGMTEALKPKIMVSGSPKITLH